MRVNDAAHVSARRMHGAVYHVTRGIDPIVRIRLQQNVAVDVDLDEARCGDLFVEIPIRVDQQLVLRAWNARGDVVVDHVRHAVHGHEPVACRKIDADLPLHLADLFADRLSVDDVELTHDFVLCGALAPNIRPRQSR